MNDPYIIALAIIFVLYLVALAGADRILRRFTEDDEGLIADAEY